MSEFDELPFPPVDEPIEFDDEARTSDTYAAVHRGNRICFFETNTRCLRSSLRTSRPRQGIWKSSAPSGATGSC